LETRERITITGRVQGVGFRPAVYRLAGELELGGFILNDSRGVTIELQGTDGQISEFLRRLQSTDSPALAKIKSIERKQIKLNEGKEKFVIRTSESEGGASSEVTADIATCGDCLSELWDNRDFRYRYPFINCTNCGPRYSIVKTIPYDRPNTTMSEFKMCRKCHGQYEDVADRRFHAQPVACSRCGPEIRLSDNKGNTIRKGTDDVITETARSLKEGRIAAIKGIGGFHLAVDALNNKAVAKLRYRKRRDHKPFAMMADSIETVKKYAVVSRRAEDVLTSPESPIVLLPGKSESGIAEQVAEGLNTFGFMLCYAPIHYLLFAEGLEVLVMTSGNISDEPLICKNQKALERLGSIADVFLLHNRQIFRQVDDSIVHFIAEQPTLLRRARGYVPAPMFLKQKADQDIFAAGADLKNTFSFVKGNQIICSEHIGDLEDAEVYEHYTESIKHLQGLFEVESQSAACDLHPGYLSRRYVLSQKFKEVIEIQHHWAHIASVLAENEMNGPVIGLSCDGTGYGTDGAIWGCECMIASLDKFERLGHLRYYPLAGADKASKEAIRPLLGLLKNIYQDEFELEDFLWLLEEIEPDKEKLKVITKQIDKNINCVLTSSLGRVFDAVAAILGLGTYNHFDAQLPISLESAAAEGIEDKYNFELVNGKDGTVELDITKMIKQILEEKQRNVPADIISARFHNTIAEGLLNMALKARETRQLNTTALSGGVFCNRYLTNRIKRKLQDKGFEVLYNRDVPSNDGGISVGQAAIAVNLLNRKK